MRGDGHGGDRGELTEDAKQGEERRRHHPPPVAGRLELRAVRPLVERVGARRGVHHRRKQDQTAEQQVQGEEGVDRDARQPLLQHARSGQYDTQERAQCGDVRDPAVFGGPGDFDGQASGQPAEPDLRVQEVVGKDHEDEGDQGQAEGRTQRVLVLGVALHTPDRGEPQGGRRDGLRRVCATGGDHERALAAGAPPVQRHLHGCVQRHLHGCGSRCVDGQGLGALGDAGRRSLRPRASGVGRLARRVEEGPDVQRGREVDAGGHNEPDRAEQPVFAIRVEFDLRRLLGTGESEPVLRMSSRAATHEAEEEYEDEDWQALAVGHGVQASTTARRSRADTPFRTAGRIRGQPRPVDLGVCPGQCV